MKPEDDNHKTAGSCPACGGTGRRAMGSTIFPCVTCGGTGRLWPEEPGDGEGKEV